MTTREFASMPMLLDRRKVLAVLGYSRWTLAKMVDAGVLQAVRPEGSGDWRYQKGQIARLAGMEGDLERQMAELKSAPCLVGEKSVRRWTGYSGKTLSRIVASGGLSVVQVPGTNGRKFRKLEIAALVGLEGC